MLDCVHVCNLLGIFYCYILNNIDIPIKRLKKTGKNNAPTCLAKFIKSDIKTTGAIHVRKFNIR